jgi:protein TonB
MTYKENNSQSQAAAYEPHSNLKYGVYALRAGYHITIIKSLFFVCAFLGVIALLSGLKPAGRKTVAVESGNLQDVVFVMDTPIPEPAPEAAAPQTEPDVAPPPRSESSAIIISDDETDVEPPATFTIRSEHNADPTSQGSGDASSLPTGSSTTTSNGTSTIISSALMVDVMPEFEGGLKALNRFISANIRYPEIDREMGKEGTVHVQFVVDIDGSVSRITLLNSAGAGMDGEATRVIGMLPKFKSPGMSKGVPVPVYFNIPIRFRIQ